jgi:ATP-binding cassette subfamily B protein
VQLTTDNVWERFDEKHPVKTALRLFSGQRARLAMAAVAFTFKSSPVWVMPLLTANVIDAVVQKKPLSALWINAAVMAVLVLQNVPLSIVYVKRLSLAVRTVETELRVALCERLQQLSIGYHRRTSAGVLQAKVIRDVENVVQTSQQVFDSGMSALTTLVGAVVLTAMRVPKFLPVFLVVVPVSAVLVYVPRRSMSDRNQAFRHEIEHMSARVNEMTYLIPITRAHGVEQDELARMDITLHHVRHEGVRLDVLNGGFAATAWVLFQLLSAACLVGAGWAALTGAVQMTAGDVVLLSSYFVAMTSSVTSLMNLAPLVAKGLESIKSMGEVLTEPDLEINDGKQKVTNVRGRVTLENVHLAYADAAKPAIVGVSLDVREGETVAFVGQSGSGKSSLLNLVIGFMSPTQGRVLLDGVDLRDVDRRSYRQFLAVVPQESLVFEGTVRDNVTYGKRELTDDRVRTALTAANAADFVEEMGGLDAIIGQRGASLSGGQRQRLAIARALIRDPRVLVLDEATSALDPASEVLVQDALAKLMHGRTTFVVAHRLSTVRGAGRIVVMQDGHIVESGGHEELLAAGGAYARLSLLDRRTGVEPVAETV